MDDHVAGIDQHPVAMRLAFDAPGDMRLFNESDGVLGVGRDGAPKDSFTRGMELRAKYTLFAEGCRGSLTKGLFERFKLREGVELTLRQLNSAFDKSQLTVIDPLGEKFDPHRHQAINTVESDAEPNTVVQVFQKGYLLNERVIRPAMVAVAKAKAGAD